jgi:Xaa-Pro aminopeptidase
VNRFVGAGGRHIDTALTALVCDTVTGTISTGVRGLKSRVQQMRLRKSEAELQQMRRAAHVTCQAHVAAMKAAVADRTGKDGRPLTESIICATLEHAFAILGDGARPAYPCVVAGGHNANTLHYVSNSQVLNDGDLVLVDAGAEVGHYASDITRTWPVSGVFSAAQREIYDVVLDCEERLIDELAKDVTVVHGRGSVAGSTMSLASLHARSVEILAEGLSELGFTGPVK